MAQKGDCSVCKYETEHDIKIDTSTSKTAWEQITGLSRFSIKRHLEHPPTSPVPPVDTSGNGVGYSFDHDEVKGVVKIEKRADRVIPLSEWLLDLEADGFDPADYNHSVGHSVWGQNSTEAGLVTLYANRFTATLKPAKQKAEAELATIDWTAAAKFIDGFTYIPAKREFLIDTAVLQPTDEQWGKTDFAGGTPETEERVLNSYSAFVDYVKEYRPREVLFARTGDGVENFCSASSQRDTNDLDLPHMVVQSFKMDLQGLKMVAPHVEYVKDARVPSNHGRWRTGMKADAGNPHADFGIAVGRQIEDTQRILDVLPNVEVVFPEALMESMTVQMSTLRLGLVHGHQTNSPDKLGEWWSRQDHGRMPTWDADILFAGHFHSYRTYQSGDGRWVIVGPASDPGSSWYSNLKGERATAGMLAVAIEGTRWRFPEIL